MPNRLKIKGIQKYNFLVDCKNIVNPEKQLRPLNKIKPKIMDNKYPLLNQIKNW